MTDCVVCNKCGTIFNGRPTESAGWYALTPTRLGQKCKSPTRHLCPDCWKDFCDTLVFC